MKRKEKIRWLREIATWLRAAAGAPSLILIMVGIYNGALVMMGKPVSLDPDAGAAKIGAPAAIAAGTIYIGFSTVATKLEILADELEDEHRPRIIIERHRSRRKSGPDGPV